MNATKLPKKNLSEKFAGLCWAWYANGVGDGAIGGTKRRKSRCRDVSLATIRCMLGKLTLVTVVIAALEFLTRCAVEVASLQAEFAARRSGD